MARSPVVMPCPVKEGVDSGVNCCSHYMAVEPSRTSLILCSRSEIGNVNVDIQ